VDSEKEQTKLLSQSSDTWLSAVVPIYTRSEIADMTDGNYNENNRFLSAFDREYFNDVPAYAENIRHKLENSKSETEHFHNQINEWQSEREILSGFTYSVDDEKQIQTEIISCQNELNNIQNQLSSLDSRKTEIRKRTAEILELKNKYQNNMRNTENSKNEFLRICEIISQYEERNNQIIETESKCRQLSRQIEKLRKEEKHLSEIIQECDIKIGQYRDKITEYKNLLDELKETPETDLISEDYSSMLAEYRLYQENYSADRQRLQEQLRRIREIIRKKANAIQRFHIEPNEYENTSYSEDAYRHAEEQLNQSVHEYEKILGEFETARVNHAKAETSLGQAKEKLAELHAELLNRSEVGSDFERRISECEIELNKAEKDNRKCTEHLSELNAEKNNTAKYAKRFETDMADYTPKLLETQQDINTIWDSIENCIENLKRAENKTKEYHRRELEPFRDTHTLFTGTLDGIISVIDNHNITGDKYFTLYERTEEDIKHYQNRIVQLSVLLRDVEDSRKQLVTNCIQRVGRLYENLSILSKKSTIQFGNVKRQMIRIDLPEIDKMSEQPAERINQYITGQVKKYLSEQENSIKSKRNHLEIRQLLNCYIGKESIPITVFKIDKSIQNSRYRSWQDAVKANSGGEQTVVLFSLLVSVMNYTRSLTSSLVHTSGVLILDNPFDRISSPHLLEPMFRIARHFNIQLICLTHIGTSAIINCFDMVYQLSFRNLPLSNVEVLKSELQQHMEHAYYFSEQLSLFNGTMSP
jgi:chromosome segregation ATPase